MTAIDELRAARKVLADASDREAVRASRTNGTPDMSTVDGRMRLAPLVVNLAPTLLTILDDAIDCAQSQYTATIGHDHGVIDTALRIARQILSSH